ncbi:MAG: ribonuclease III [Thermodesulfobacteriota bacterium]
MTTLDALLKKNAGQLEQFQGGLGHRFREPALLQRAFIHSSYAFEQGQDLPCDNEILEFLGDAVLDLTIGNALIKSYPTMKEGELTRLRAALVQEGYLAEMARFLSIGDCLLLGKGENASRGREKPSILSSAFEAVMGAVFLDGGYQAAALVAERLFVPCFQEKKEDMYLADSKSRLQELIQARYNEGPIYVLERTEGPDHAKLFYVAVRFQDKVLARGTARSKKEAEQQAAAEAVRHFDELGL